MTRKAARVRFSLLVVGIAAMTVGITIIAGGETRPGQTTIQNAGKQVKGFCVDRSPTLRGPNPRNCSGRRHA